METRFLKTVIELFVRDDRQERLRYLLEAPKRHSTLIHEFDTSEVFDPAVLVDIPPAEQFGPAIQELMKSLGAGVECIDVLDALGGNSTALSLEEALDEHVGFTTGTVLFCPGTRVGFYEGGHPKDRFVLFRAPVR